MMARQRQPSGLVIDGREHAGIIARRGTIRPPSFVPPITPSHAVILLTEVSHLLDLRPCWPLREFHPEPLTDPYVSLSTYTARATARRLPPSVEQGAHPGKPVGPNQPRWPASFAPAPLQRLHLLRGSPPLSGASVLSASRLEPLAPFPLPSPARFCRSVPEPGRASRRLHAGCRLGSIRTSPKLIPEVGSTPGF